MGDEARALTAEGRVELREMAAELAEEMTELQGIATSPLVRAVQTAEILAQAWRLDRVESRGELATASDTEALVRLCKQLQSSGDGWALVGHNPTMAEAAAALLRLPETPRFRKGAVAALERSGSGFTLAWACSPGRKKSRSL